MSLYAYFGGLGADKQATYELALERLGPDYLLTAVMIRRHAAAAPLGLQTLWVRLHQPTGRRWRRVVYQGTSERCALLALLQAACEANMADLGQRFCYVLPSVPSQPGALTVFVPRQLRHDNSLPFHPQLWQAGRPLDTLPIELHGRVPREALKVRYSVQG